MPAPGDGGVGGLDFFGRDVALDFELPQIAEQRARLRRETIGFCLQRADPLVDASRERIGRAAICAARRGRAGRAGEASRAGTT